METLNRLMDKYKSILYVTVGRSHIKLHVSDIEGFRNILERHALNVKQVRGNITDHKFNVVAIQEGNSGHGTIVFDQASQHSVIKNLLIHEERSLNDK